MDINNLLTQNSFGIRRSSFGFGSLIFTLIFGAIFVAGGLFALNATKIDPSWIKVDGKIVSVNTSIGSGNSGTTYMPVVQYSVAGQMYRVTSSSGSSAYPTIGGVDQVAYNPQYPADAKVVQSATTTLFIWIFPITGILIFLVGPLLFIAALKRNNTIKKLQQTGQKIKGILSDIQMVGANNRRTMYKIVVTATDPAGVVQNYISDTLSGIGGLTLATVQKTPIPIDIYLNPSNPTEYYVDVSEIPSLTPERITQLLQSATQQNIPIPMPSQVQ